MAAMQGNIDDLVEAKEQRLLTYNAYARANPVCCEFCLCSKCLVQPIMNCDVMIPYHTMQPTSTAYAT